MTRVAVANKLAKSTHGNTHAHKIWTQKCEMSYDAMSSIAIG